MKLETLKEITVEKEESFLECAQQFKDGNFSWDLSSLIASDVKVIAIQSLWGDKDHRI